MKKYWAEKKKITKKKTTKSCALGFSWTLDCERVLAGGVSRWGKPDQESAASLKSRAPDAWDEANRRLQAKIGELLMENELLYAKVDQLEAGGPLARRRST